jgi:hypothetical protein
MFKVLNASLLLTCITPIFLAQPCQSQRVDPSTIQGKVLVGYQGWFRCPGDGSPENAWARWFKRDTPTAAVASPAGRTWVDDLFPDVSDMDPSSLCPLPNLRINGKQAYVFSSFPKATTETHFRWMRQYNIDGALMQRFVSVIPTYHAEHDVVLRNAIAAAEHNGRVIAVEYDISGGKADAVYDQLTTDWLYLTNDLKITKSPAYLNEKGKPVVSIWGFGVKGRIDDPNLMGKIIEWFKTEGHATVMGGVPSGWATPLWDALPDPGWSAVYKDLDIIQPWTVGRYKDDQTAAAWKETNLIPDIAVTRRNHQEYMPVIYPGFSWHNLNPDDRTNRIPREGGKFFWEQAMYAKSAGATMLKIAMFDEANEGAAIFKIAPTSDAAPKEAPFVTLDADGYRLPSDWYLRLAGEISRVYHGEEPVSMTMPAQPMNPSAR